MIPTNINNTNTNTNKSIIQCKMCNEKFIDYYKLSGHIRKIHIKKLEINNLQQYYDKYILTDISIKYCKVCKSDNIFNSIRKGYSVYCCLKCSQSDPEFNKIRYNKSVDAMISKYGTHTNRRVPEIEEKRKQTMISKYGVENAGQIESGKVKSKKTKLERYGDENYNNKAKYKKTCIEKYGVIHPMKLDSVKEKQKEVMQLKYGVDYNIQNNKIKQKMIQTKINRYGGIGYDSNIIQEKIKKTLMSRYGVDSPQKNKEIHEKTQGTNSRKKYKLIEFCLPDRRIIKYQSESELRFIKYCINCNIYIENGNSIYYLYNDRLHKYYIDFKIKENDKWRLVEIKKKHKWWFIQKHNGIIKSKTLAAQQFSKDNNYLPYKIYFNF